VNSITLGITERCNGNECVTVNHGCIQKGWGQGEVFKEEVRITSDILKHGDSDWLIIRLVSFWGEQLVAV
jgi:hypothetical protein